MEQYSTHSETKVTLVVDRFHHSDGFLISELLSLCEKFQREGARVKLKEETKEIREFRSEDPWA